MTCDTSAITATHTILLKHSRVEALRASSQSTSTSSKHTRANWQASCNSMNFVQMTTGRNAL